MPDVVVDRYQDVWTVTHRGRGTDAFGSRDNAVKAAVGWATRLSAGGGDVGVVVRQPDGGFRRVWSPEDTAAEPGRG